LKGAIYKNSALVFSSLLVAGLSTPQNACAQQMPGREVQKYGDYRVGSFVGAFIPNSAAWTGNGAINGFPFSASGNLSLKTGFAAGGLVGRSFGEYLNIDVEAGYAESKLNKFDGTVSITGIGNSNGPTPVKGRVHAWSAFVNGLITPFGTNNAVTFYIGGGPGVARATAELDSFGFNSMMIPINSKNTQTAFALNAIIGVDFKLLPRDAPQQLELGIGGEFVWINARSLGSGSGIQAHNEAVSGEIIGAVVEYRF
jgi:opacity protein-like surface antigen